MALAAEEDVFSVASWVVYVLTFAWFAALFYSRHQRLSKTRTARTAPAKTIIRRQAAPVGNRFAKTTHILFSTAKRAVSKCMSRRELIARRAPAERQAILTLVSRFYAMALTLEERLIQVNRRAGDEEGFSMTANEQDVLQSVANDATSLSSAVGNAVGVNNPHTIQELNDCSQQLLDLATKLGDDAVARLDWGVGSWQFEAMERDIVKHIRFADQRWLGEDDDEDASDDAGDQDQSWAARQWARLVEAIPHPIRSYPYFYSMFFGGYVAILMSFFVYMGSGDVRGHTFLSVPPYYDLQNVKLQAYLVPLVYGVMHGSLYCLGWLAVPMTRGFIRDLGLHARWLRPHVPIDDTVYFHQTAGVLSIGGLFVGSTFFLIAMTASCYDEAVADEASRERACTALDPVIVDATTKANDELLFDSFAGASYLDPRDNVLFLREIVWPTWFFGMPLIYWGRQPPSWLPRILKVNWYGFVYYIHIVFAWVTVLCALYARFEVFYPVIISWGIYFIDKFREVVFKTYASEILVDARVGKATSRCYENSKDGQPTLVNLIMNKPYGFQPGAGQWLYVQVPDIDHVWHPFSLATSSYDDYVELHIGIRGEWSDKRGPEEEWLQDPKHATWTYKLMKKFRKRADQSVDTGMAAPIKVRLRGPYGSPFTKCFNPKYTAVVLIGAGTGLTSALSMLKELVYRRMQGEDQGRYVWFVWSCRRVDDLLWCWRTLEKTLQDACREGAFDLGDDWCPWTSNMLDWLSITIYISRADRAALDYFLDKGSGNEEKLPDSSVINMAGSDDNEYIEMAESSRKASQAPAMSTAKPSRVASGASAQGRNRRQSALILSSARGKSIRQSKLRQSKRAGAVAPKRGTTVRGAAATSKLRLFPTTEPEQNEEDDDFSSYQLLAPEDVEVEDEFAWMNRSVRGAHSKLSVAPIAEEDEEEGEYHLSTAPTMRGSDGVPIDADAPVDPKPFIKGAMTRSAAESLLHSWNLAGSFVVRFSEEKGASVLSYLQAPGARAVHFVLRPSDDNAQVWTLGGLPVDGTCSTDADAVEALMRYGHDLLPAPLIWSVPQKSDGLTPLQAAAAAVASNPKDRNLKLALKRALEGDLKARVQADIHTWLQQQVMNASMDHKDGHIVKLLLWVKSFLEDAPGSSSSAPARMAVCFCGPSGLAATIGEAAEAVGGGFEFNAEHQ